MSEQPRVPAGSPKGGEWTSTQKGVGSTAPTSKKGDWDEEKPAMPEKYLTGNVKSPENFIDVWTGDPRSLTATVAQHAAEELGWGRAYDSNREAGGPARNGTSEQRAMAKQVLQKLYQDTQESFKTKTPEGTIEHPPGSGEKYIYLYRGTASKKHSGSIESWTSSRKTAQEFAEQGDEDNPGPVARLRMPLRAVLAWHKGPHWEKDLGESEFIVSVGVLHV